MPSIASRTMPREEMEKISDIGLRPITHPIQRPTVGAFSPKQPGLSTLLRCPLPIISAAHSDNLRQFYRGGTYPQFRFSPPNPLS